MSHFHCQLFWIGVHAWLNLLSLPSPLARIYTRHGQSHPGRMHCAFGRQPSSTFNTSYPCGLVTFARAVSTANFFWIDVKAWINVLSLPSPRYLHIAPVSADFACVQELLAGTPPASNQTLPKPLGYAFQLLAAKTECDLLLGSLMLAWEGTLPGHSQDRIHTLTPLM